MRYLITYVPTPVEVVTDIVAEEVKFFTVLDGGRDITTIYRMRHIQPLTLFITPFGGFKNCQAPYGLSSM